MKKIDFHIHTKSTLSDSNMYKFDIDSLKEYVERKKIDAIAITNHNVFDLEQYYQIKDNLTHTMVFPGVEIDLENGHLLLIAPVENAVEVAKNCVLLSNRIKTNRDTLSFQEFREIFKNTDEYLLIPHYEKNPGIKTEIIELFDGEISAGEVSSPNKFNMIQNDKNKLTPLLFSDMRCYKGVEFQNKQTYISVDEMSISAIKLCLKDPSKVSLNKEGITGLFEVFDDGFMASTGLNVIIGNRSSGKTKILERLMENFDNAKYIKQFELVSKDEKEEKKVFDKTIKCDYSEFADKYLKELKTVVDDILKVDKISNNKNLEEYVKSVVENAKCSDNLDSFSKTNLFNANEISNKDEEKLTKLITATITILDDISYSDITEKYINKESLSKMLKELIIILREHTKYNKVANVCNVIVNNVKDKLASKTSVPQIKSIDLKKLYIESKKIKRFEDIVLNMQTEKCIAKQTNHGFTVEVVRKKIKNATEIQKIIQKKYSFVDAYKLYNSPYDYITYINNQKVLNSFDFPRLFVNLDYNILNSHGLNVSGGERAEYNLLNVLEKVEVHDYLLLDEPESSFDNIFLNKKINTIIKNISKDIPVFVVTHNNNVGHSIKADYTIYTEREIIDGEAEFFVYGGKPSSKKLYDINGKEKNNIDVIMKNLEGGTDVYKERGQEYEILRDKR